MHLPGADPGAITSADLRSWSQTDNGLVKYAGIFLVKFWRTEYGMCSSLTGRDQFRKNNNATKGRHRNPRSPQEIFAIVKQLKDHEVDYSLVSSNCEHFVTSVKYKQDGKTNEPPDVVPVVVNHHGTSSQVRYKALSINLQMQMVLTLVSNLVGLDPTSVRFIKENFPQVDFYMPEGSFQSKLSKSDQIGRFGVAYADQFLFGTHRLPTFFCQHILQRHSAAVSDSSYTGSSLWSSHLRCVKLVCDQLTDTHALGLLITSTVT